MTRTELEHVKSVLLKIKSEHPSIARAIAYIDKDIALREEQKNFWKDNLDDPFEYPY